MIYFDGRIFSNQKAGVYRYAENFLGILLSSNINVTLITNKKIPKSFKFHNEKNLHIKCFSIFKYIPGTIFVMFFVGLLIKRKSKFIGINHAVPLYRLNTLLVIHDLMPYYFPKTMTFLNKNLMHFGLSMSVKFASDIITVSKFTKLMVNEFFSPKKEITVIENDASHMEKFLSKINHIDNNKIKKLINKKPYILSVGSNEPRKNLIEIISAFEKLCDDGYDGLLLLVGPEGWKNNNVHEAISSSSHRPSIHFTGFISDEALAYLYKHCDCFVFVSLYEGYGIPPLEAISFGAPVICTTRSEIPYLNVKGPIVFYEPQTGNLAEKISCLIMKGKNKDYKFQVPNMRKAIHKNIKLFVD